MWEVARDVFTKGPGLVLIQIMFVSTGTWMMSYIAGAAGKGREAQMIKTAGTFICIGLVANTVYVSISKAAKVMGF